MRLYNCLFGSIQLIVLAYTNNCLFTPLPKALAPLMAGAFFCIFGRLRSSPLLPFPSSLLSRSFYLIFSTSASLLLLLFSFLLFLPLKGCCSREARGGFCLTCFALLWLNSPLSYVFLTILYNSFRFLLAIRKDFVSLLPDTEVRSVCIFRLVYPSLSSRRALLAGIVCRRGGWVGDEARHNKGVY
jgi:hypothetical protein